MFLGGKESSDMNWVREFIFVSDHLKKDFLQIKHRKFENH